MTKEIQQGGKVCEFAKLSLKGETVVTGEDERVDKLWSKLQPFLERMGT